ncbi:MAG: (2Fe-2S)-binding protein [Bacteroidetes bacterium CG23_combo_of_CG06-09_8_20_14_all_32_9]|nr:MAG: (2Fe-2S)-binding protein [Bacteroidetes bacterium CG23_combo_of_CG06-09_8_20_14_all_32_9]
MSEILLQIDGKEIKAREGMTVLEVAQSAGIFIPTLCYHKKLKPYGGCRLCIVEAESGGRTKLVASCVHPAEEKLVVRTCSEKVNKIRKNLLELMLAHAPESPILQELAHEYGADKNRFGKESLFCVHCGLCVRYCAEVKKLNAIGFINRGISKEISFIPEIASKECNNCKECFELCPTSYLQAAFVLTEALAFPKASSGTSSDG